MRLQKIQCWLTVLFPGIWQITNYFAYFFSVQKPQYMELTVAMLKCLQLCYQDAKHYVRQEAGHWALDRLFEMKFSPLLTILPFPPLVISLYSSGYSISLIHWPSILLSPPMAILYSCLHLQLAIYQVNRLKCCVLWTEGMHRSQ